MEVLGDTSNSAQETQIIATTGTKGKTTVTRALAFILNHYLNEPVLEVDTSRVRLGGENVMPFREVMRLYGQRPTIAPGRFLYALKDQKHPTAVLEASISCAVRGLGYFHHKVGVFTNVYDDHIGEKIYLRSRKDIANAKAFIFDKIQSEGYAVFNADDPLVTEQALKIDPSRRITLIACTLDKTIAKEYPLVVTADSERITIIRTGKSVWSVPLTEIEWIYRGLHEPSLRNVLSVVGALYGFFSGKIPEKVKRYITGYIPEETGGRMVIKQAPAGYKLILDFAHEGESMSQLGAFAHHFKERPENRVIGVVRLSGERPDQHIITTTHQFAPHYDQLIIRNKRFSPFGKTSKFHRTEGAVADLMVKAAKGVGVNALKTTTERDALQLAARLAKKGDVIVMIIDNAEHSLELAKEVFKI